VFSFFALYTKIEVKCYFKHGRETSGLLSSESQQALTTCQIVEADLHQAGLK